MKKINILTITGSLLLISCGGGVDNPPVNNKTKIDCANNIASTATKNSIQLTIHNWITNIPMKGVVVQLDHNGKCIFSDVDGKVNFDNLTAAPHDIHVFGQDGFGWKSYYDLPVSNTTVLTLPTIKIKNPAEEVIVDAPQTEPKSYIIYSGAIEFKEANSEISFEYFSDGKHKIINESVDVASLTHDLQYQFNAKVGTSVNDELWAFEKITVNGDTRLVDASHTLPVNRTTTEKNTGDVLNSINLSIPFSVNSRKLTDLMTIESLTLPTGFNINNLSVSAILSSSVLGVSRLFRTNTTVDLFSTSQYDPAVSKTINAYLTPFAVNQTSLNLHARSGNSATWSYSGNVALSTGMAPKTFIFKPKLTTVPSLFVPIGNTIKWNTDANVVLQKNEIQILSGTGKLVKRWNIKKSGNSNSLTLPEVPAGVVPLLVDGKNYNLYLNGTYEYNSTYGDGKATETYSSSVTWKR
jgi:hypothetical protein